MVKAPRALTVEAAARAGRPVFRNRPSSMRRMTDTRLLGTALLKLSPPPLSAVLFITLVPVRRITPLASGSSGAPGLRTIW